MANLALLLAAVTLLVVSRADSSIDDQRMLPSSASTTEKSVATNYFPQQLSPRQNAKGYAGPSGLRGPPGPQSDIYGFGPSHPGGEEDSGLPGVAAGRQEDKVSIDHRGRIRPEV